MKSDSHETWKCADPELERQIRCFLYGERSDVPRLTPSDGKSSHGLWPGELKTVYYRNEGVAQQRLTATGKVWRVWYCIV
jgi:hypothetical protein